MDMFLWSLLAAGGSYIFLSIMWWLLQVIANWMIFKKAGEAGWKSIIPVWSGHVSYRIAWNPVFFWLGIVLSVAETALTQAGLPQENTMWAIVQVALIVVYMVITLVYTVKLSKAFGKGVLFALGLLVLQPIFLMILAFGSAQYVRSDR